ncbi:MAG TPA: DNA polymerase III subunit chi [Gammaproteobacteria bacterium]|nr:DNA polymerase III subunit chi [Gammaproteobacteria bacterium]
MPQVDFYILHTIRLRQEKNRLACQLADKAWHQGYPIYIQTNSIIDAEKFDKLLWVFKEDSFLPHDIYPDISSTAPIRIGYSAEICPDMEVLINLTETVPPFFEQFKRIAEIVDDTPIAREAGRTRYRFYQERKALLKVHKINR